MYFLLAHYYSVKAIISSEVFFSFADVMHASVTDFFFCLNSCDQCVPSLCHIRPLKQCVLIQQKVRKLNTGSKFPTSIFNRIILKNVFGLFLYAYSLEKKIKILYIDYFIRISRKIFGITSDSCHFQNTKLLGIFYLQKNQKRSILQRLFFLVFPF